MTKQPVKNWSVRTRSGHSSRQRVVTLIELLIAVGILGLLAYIALPIYTNYYERAKITEALALVEIAKKAMEEYHSIHGVFPESNKEAGIPDSRQIKGDYVKRVTIHKPRRWTEPRIKMNLVGNPDTWGPRAVLVWAPSSMGGSITWNCCWQRFTGNANNRFIPKFCPNKTNRRRCPP